MDSKYLCIKKLKEKLNLHKLLFFPTDFSIKSHKHSQQTIKLSMGKKSDPRRNVNAFGLSEIHLN